MSEVYAFRRFAVAADIEPDAEAVTYTMQCAVCGACGPVVEVSKEAELPGEAKGRAARDAAAWVRQHRFAQREHLTYRLVETRPYRLVPGAWQ
ncbi:DUF7848 domain-containing protein [Streptomyces alkaliterrae]|uniref:DUF7848 domain-containing protein n=1 Tax=Streptomyces alkaliterrae TaxID=2213162 RepID=A0A5P0YYB0_9ACTN|nr:hypothetical protein [Streptomyces alkaliterrae]MBB1256897.1 hypothetical protein [Streptomyces alkaliterrae]MBB1262445.1 hypothetical protein [Streptomyces alkaliterrae]MQS05285.1 hypothetical protein [Streptomyces alkaliterrae]